MSTRRRRSHRCFALAKKPRRALRQGSALIFVLVVLVMAAVVGGGLWYYMSDEGVDPKDMPVLHTVSRGSFEHIVLEQGEVESSENVEIKCEVKARNSSGTAILWVIDEGAHVTKGDKLVELDASALEQELKQQRIVVNSSQTLVITAKADLKKAEIAKTEYLDGTFKTEEYAILGEIETANQNLRSAQLSLESGEKLAIAGLVTSLQLEADQYAVQNAQTVLSQAEGRLEALRKFTKEKMLVELDAAIETARAKVDNEMSSHEEELAKLAEILQQIDKCVIFAPQEGQVVHANEFSSRGGNAEFVVEPGAMVREMQTIIRLPNPERMQVKATINEASINLVREGMPVAIQIGAFENEVLQGVVQKVNKYAEPSSWFSSQVKEYATFIKVMNPPPDLRTGMTAEVRIFVDQRDDALQIPVQALYEVKGHPFTLVKSGDKWETREIKLGASNSKHVLVAEGLSAGEVVALDVRSHIDKLHIPADLLDVREKRMEVIAEQAPEGGAVPTAVAAGRPAGGGSFAGGPDGGGRGPGGRSGPGGGGFNPAQMITRLFEQYDTDSDGKLSADEMQQIPEERRSRTAQNDTNGDGFVDRAEMTTAMDRIRQAMQSGGPPTGSE